MIIIFKKKKKSRFFFPRRKADHEKVVYSRKSEFCNKDFAAVGFSDTKKEKLIKRSSLHAGIEVKI